MTKIWIVLFFIVVLMAVGHLLFLAFYPFPKNIKYGVTFSPKFASELGIDWKQLYVNVLDDLSVRHLRLPVYWDEDLESVDFMLSEAQRRGAKVILVLGVRQPRWPECHVPHWAKEFSIQDRQKRVLEFITEVVERYKNYDVITAWQVENEALLKGFGEGCDPTDKEFLKAEVELVRDLDKRQIILTDSGELGFWVTPMKLSDIFGTTLYRSVHDRILGSIEYPILPYFYNIKSTVIRSLFAPNSKRTIIIELQEEPWSPNNNLVETPIKQQSASFSLNKFKQNITFARQTGFDEIYLWGVEWWYFMAQNGNPEYLNYAKTLFGL